MSKKRKNGGAREGAGRKPLPDELRRSAAINVRCTEAEREHVDESAEIVAEDTSAFVRKAALDRATRIKQRMARQ